MRSTIGRAALALLATSLLAGCNLAPAYHPPVVPTPAAYKPLPGWTPATPSDGAPRGAWWAVFDDPILNRLEQKLDGSNPDLQAAVARYDEARGYVEQARGGLLPTLGLQGNAMQNRESRDRPLRGSNLPDNYGSDQVNGVAGYELDLWGKLRNTLHSRKALAQASDDDRAAIQLSLEAQLAGTYFQLRGLDADALLLTRTVAAYQKSYDLTVTLYKGKVAAEMDVSRASVQLNTAKTAAADIEANRALMADALAVLVGESPSTFALDPADVPMTLPAIPEGIPATLLQRRPDIASAERAIASANAEIGVARAAFYPTITLGANGGVMSQGTNPFSLADIFWSLGPSISLPLFDGGQLKGQLAYNYARFRETSAHYKSVALTAFKEVEDNRALLLRLEQEGTSSSAAAAAAQQTTTAAMGLYSNGATSYLDVVTAQTALLQAQQAALDIRTRRFVAAVNLIRALGGGWTANGPT
ncbi:efflux transporter outer membrane subunit [Sphingomonas nostoxanthinifaciens]|uniref:efflux transporter outer membrane subunit n=1 Tax=Sphingomonas nostoxanthinifaciens TaxID=2872652 RepID=UPI001CC1FA77|nr:efflux transporter outer membrane subunit [Sphingomonas nostoxanthinifaciens]